MKTAELSGAALDWAVAQIEGYAEGPNGSFWITEDDCVDFKPATDWSHGGPIIEREKISVWARGNEWAAESFVPNQQGLECVGPTPLVAAMRCYVAMKLGNEIEIPAELREAA